MLKNGGDFNMAKSLITLHKLCEPAYGQFSAHANVSSSNVKLERLLVSCFSYLQQLNAEMIKTLKIFISQSLLTLLLANMDTVNRATILVKHNPIDAG